jgi:hypothetical protein
VDSNLKKICANFIECRFKALASLSPSFSP